MTDFRLATEADLPALRRLVERAYRGDTARRAGRMKPTCSMMSAPPMPNWPRPLPRRTAA
jgi:hypothetical protein